MKQVKEEPGSKLQEDAELQLSPGDSKLNFSC